MYEHSGLGRRDLLRATLGLGATAMALSACGSPLTTGLYGAAPPSSTLTYWNLFTGGDGERMTALQKTYQLAHPETHLDAVTLAWGNPYYTKLSLAARGGMPPDVAISHATRMTPLAQAGLLDPIAPADLARFGLTPDKFTSAAWQRCHVGDTLYAVPLDTHPYVLYYHTEVCKKAGLLEPDGTLKTIAGADDLLSALRAAKKVTGKYGVVTADISDPAMCWRLFSTLYWQLGGTVLTDNGSRVVLDDDKALTALNFIKTMVDEGLMASEVDDTGVPVLFSNGAAGFMFDGEWDVTVYLTNKTPFGMTGFPHVFGDKYACQADSHTFVLPHDAGRTPAKTTRSLEFIRTMLEHSQIWAAGGHIPAFTPVRDSAAYRSMVPQSSYAYVADSVHYDEPAWYSGSGSDLEIFMGQAVSALQQGGLAPRAALADMRRNLEQYAKIPSPA
ncbi:extracellular solute-binding protein [Nocardia alni]|uniref:extracellular solute-binding protein n=1 Tax=Nocardia alni TaxID=2815723 RepID=UPI001C240CA3|nr:extracellular solute-binding protein [Nocardia alni]